MRSLERGKGYESLERSIGRIAAAYGFSSAPANIPRKSFAVGALDGKTAASSALAASVAPGTAPAQVWGAARKGSSTLISFGIFSTRHAIAPAILVKTALSIAETAGFTELAVSVSSVGDLESRRRFTRELGNWFRKHLDETPEDVRELAAKDPDAAYRTLIQRQDPLLESMPRSIDYLSENSRKTMLTALSLFESVGIPYTLDPRLAAESGTESELLFAVTGTDKRHNRVTVATGGRYDELMKRLKGQNAGPAVIIALELDGRLDIEASEETPECFVVHVGDIAKLRAFALLEALWRAHLAVGNALMAENLREGVERAHKAKSRYIAIIGQREALDDTVIIRSIGSELQMTLPFEKVTAHVGRGR